MISDSVQSHSQISDCCDGAERRGSVGCRKSIRHPLTGTCLHSVPVFCPLASTDCAPPKKEELCEMWWMENEQDVTLASRLSLTAQKLDPSTNN